MEYIQANPVEIMNKDIYMIENQINNKKYIGQAINAENRFKEHCKPSSAKYSLISKAISKYGKNNFKITILEHQTPNYNEREMYWIKRYNTQVPNGYNILSGGENPPLLKGEQSPQCKITDEVLGMIRYDLKNTSLSMKAIADKYKVSKRQIMRINNGESRVDSNMSYPIRKNKNINGKLTDKDVDDIISMLKYSYTLNGTIARMYGVDVHAIDRINAGETHRKNDVSYPIRKWKSSGKILFTYEQVTEIIDLLKNTNLSMNKIAKKYGTYVNPIMTINNGSSKKYRREGVKYPIRNYS